MIEYEDEQTIFEKKKSEKYEIPSQDPDFPDKVILADSRAMQVDAKPLIDCKPVIDDASDREKERANSTIKDRMKTKMFASSSFMIII